MNKVIEDDPWTYSDKPRPCLCGNIGVRHIITQPRLSCGYPARRAVQCLKCGYTGPDTCHGCNHANRRWNWRIGDALEEAKAEGARV